MEENATVIHPAQWVLAAVGAGLLVRAGRIGVFREQAFQDAAVRPAFGLLDMAAGAVLWLGGMSLGVEATKIWMGQSPLMLQALVVQLLGWLPVSVYLLCRAAVGFPAGAWDLGLTVNGRMLRQSLLYLLAAFPLTVLAGVIGSLLAEWLDQPVPELAHRMLQEMVRNPRPGNLLMLFISAVIVAPLAEELFFRRLIQKTTGELLKGKWPAIVATSVFFSLIHLAAVSVEPEAGAGDSAQVMIAWPALGVLFTLSVVLGFAYEKTASLWTPVLIHAVFNALQLAAVWMLQIAG